MTTKGTGTVGALETTLRILRALKDLGEAGVTELSKELDIPKSTVHAHLNTLRENEYVVRENGTYHIGLRFLELGEHTRNRMKIYDVARPQVEYLVEQTGELSNLLVKEHGMGVYVYRARGEQAVHLDTYAGMRVHLHCTALGKAILAYQPEEEVERILNRRGLPERTSRTITDRDELWDELQSVREVGYAQDDAERLPGLRCVAAPITDERDVAVAAISVAAPTSRMKGARYEEEIPELVRSAANVIELNMTYA